MVKKIVKKNIKKGGDFLGKGAYGCVYDAKTNLNNFELFKNLQQVAASSQVAESDLAAKLFTDKTEYEKERDDIKTILPIINHLNITPTYYGYIDNIVIPENIIEGNIAKCITNNDISIFQAIIMEKCDKNLNDVDLQTDDFIQKLKTFIDKLHKFHDLGYIHCDIKPDNIMINSNGNLVLIDLGFLLEKEHINDTTNIGFTPFYMSPIVMIHHKPANGLRQYRLQISNHKDFKSVKNALDTLINTTYAYSFDVFLDNIEDLFIASTDKNIYNIIDLYSLVISLQYISIQKNTIILNDIIIGLLQKIVPVVQKPEVPINLYTHYNNIDTSQFGF